MPDVLLLDFKTSKMDSFEFSNLVRNSERFSELPIVIFSALKGEKQYYEEKDIGVSALLAKPYQEGVLIENLQNLMGARYPLSE